METVEPIEPGFSTGDAQHPPLEFEDESLLVRFTDWQERLVSVRFTGVAAVRWQEIEQLLPGKRADQSYRVVASAWLAEHLRQAARCEEDRLQHLRFNFNACGQLDVLCRDFEVNVEQGHPLDAHRDARK